MHPSFPLFSHSSSEQPSSADVGTTCPRLFCMLPGSDPPPCKPLPFCGISCTAGSSTPSSVAAFVLGGEVLAKKRAAKALDELHTHICISALCGRGVSVRWENGYAVFQHHCYDPQLSGLEGQQPRQKKGLKIQLCKKCHRTLHSCAVPISKKPNIDFLNQRIVQSCLNHFLLSPHPLPSIKLLPRCGYFLPVGHLRNTHSELELCRNTP